MQNGTNICFLFNVLRFFFIYILEREIEIIFFHYEQKLLEELFLARLKTNRVSIFSFSLRPKPRRRDSG